MLSMQTMVSVIIPTYKRPHFIRQAIESVISQTYKDIEIIVVDDNTSGSEERLRTERIVSEIKDSRIRYIQNVKHLGGAGSRNAAIQVAQGEYIAFLDDDDVYLPDRIRVQVQAMMNNNWDVSVMDGATYRYETGKKVSERHQHIKARMSNDDLIRCNLIYHISGTNTFMFRTDFIRRIGGFDLVPACQEYMLIQKALGDNPRFGYLPVILIKNYQHGGEQISRSPQKLLGQKMLIKNKKKYFYLLSGKEKRQVLCRHHGVLFYVYYQMRKYLHAGVEAAICFFISPISAIIWFKEYKGKITA